MWIRNWEWMGTCIRVYAITMRTKILTLSLHCNHFVCQTKSLDFFPSRVRGSYGKRHNRSLLSGILSFRLPTKLAKHMANTWSLINILETFRRRLQFFRMPAKSEYRTKYTLLHAHIHVRNGIHPDRHKAYNGLNKWWYIHANRFGSLKNLFRKRCRTSMHL